MMLLERLYTGKNKDSVWKHVVGTWKNKETRTVKPLYVSDLKDQDYLSVVFYTEVLDDMARFLVDHVSVCKDIVDTKTLMFMKPVFLPMPHDRPRDLNRFSIYIRAQPVFYSEIYNSILNHEFSGACFPNYLAYVFGDYDILMTMLAKDKGCLSDFIDSSIKPLNGVQEAIINPIKRTELLTSTGQWREIQRSLLCIPPWISKRLKEHYLYDTDPTAQEDLMLTGAMSDEL